MVHSIRNHHITGAVHRHVSWAVEAIEDALTVLTDYFSVLRIPNNGGNPARRRELDDCVARAEKASAVAQHKHATWETEPGDGDSGHGSFEGGRARTLGG